MRQETIEQLLERVRDYDQHTSDTDIDRLCDEVERLRSTLRDIKRHCGHVSINNGTGTLGLFCDMILTDKAN